MYKVRIPVILKHGESPREFDSNPLETREIKCDSISVGRGKIIYEHNGMQSEIQILPRANNTETTIEDCDTGIIYTIEEFRKKLGK